MASLRRDPSRVEEGTSKKLPGGLKPAMKSAVARSVAATEQIQSEVSLYTQSIVVCEDTLVLYVYMAQTGAIILHEP